MNKPLTVKQLIAKLKTMDPDAIPLVTSSNFEHGYALVPVTSIHQYDTGNKGTRTFRDAFDGEMYSKEIWNISGGSTKVISIS